MSLRNEKAQFKVAFRRCPALPPKKKKTLLSPCICIDSVRDVLDGIINL
jgi:hypothetical protein